MLLPGGIRPTWAEINLDNLAFNFHSVKNFVGKDLMYMAVVKADAYGHNALKCAQKLEDTGVDCFGVALPEEGLELRNGGIKKPIICLGGFWSGQEDLLLEKDLSPVIYSLEMAERINYFAKKKGIFAKIHVKIDTGMGRIGVRFEDVKDFVGGFKKFKNLRLAGLMTHFAAAENLQQNDFTDKQIRRFYDALEIFENNEFHPLYNDLANSPGAIVHPNSRGNMVRLGGVLYGLSGDILPIEVQKPVLRPVMSLFTRIAYLKKVPKGETLGYGRTFKTKRNSLIATIPIGYHDGYNRLLSNCGRVIINGAFAPVVGRISMDWTTIDVTDLPEVKVNYKVTLIGKQGELDIKVEELAQLTNTISYEITCGISKRVIKICN
jgi:alanine racemase